MIPAKVSAVICDVDGVLTPNRLGFADTADIRKSFHVRDGHGLVKLQRAGVKVAWVTGRDDAATHQRASELGIEVRVVPHGTSKTEPVRELIATWGLKEAEVVFVGDDTTDLAAFEVVGWPVAVADAVPAVRQAARRVTTVGGGEGAIREVVDWILERRTAGSRPNNPE